MLSDHEGSHHGCLSRPYAQGSAISTFNPLAAQCVRQWQGQLEHLCQSSTSSVGRNGQFDVLKRMYQTAISAPKLADFWVIYLGLAYPGIL